MRFWIAPKSLNSRWEKISTSCILFRACVTQAEALYESGTSEVNVITKAKDLYVIKERKHQPFKLDHCWSILKYQEKWAEPLSESSQTNDLNSPLEGNTPISEDASEVSASQGRPTGRNKAKTKRRIPNEKDPVWQEMMNNSAKTQELIEKQIDIQQRKVDQQQQRIAIRQQEAAMRQQEIDMKARAEEMEIINKDLSNLTPFSKAYYVRRKRSILDTADMPRAARNLDFSAGSSGGNNEEAYVPISPTNSSHPGNEDIRNLNNDCQEWFD